MNEEEEKIHAQTVRVLTEQRKDLIFHLANQMLVHFWALTAVGLTYLVLETCHFTIFYLSSSCQ